MEHCSKKSAGAAVAAQIPDDILVDIFFRVPAKSLCRFKCVSKAWRDLITDPNHCKKFHQAMQGLFIMAPVSTGGYCSCLVDLTAGSVPLDVDPSFSFLSPVKRNLVLSDSCNGLIYFGYCELPYHDGLSDIVCNPTTKQWTCVPPCAGSDDRSCYTYLAFDPDVSSHFHLVQFQFSEEGPKLEALHAYSSEHGTWSRNQIDSQEGQGLAAGWHHHVSRFLPCYEDPCHAFVNGFLYLVVQELDQRQIVVVDVQGKARRIITLPCLPEGSRLTYYLEQSQGCLHCITQEILCGPLVNYKLSIWVLQGYDTQEWVLKNTVSSLDIFGDLTRPIFDIFDVRVVHIHQDRNLVFLFQNQRGKLIACNMDHKEASVIATVKDWIPTNHFCSLCSLFFRIPSSHKAQRLPAMYELLAACLNSSRLR